MKPSLNETSQLLFANRFYHQAMHTRQSLNHQVSLISQTCLSNRIEKIFLTSQNKFNKIQSALPNAFMKSLNYKPIILQASEILNLHGLPGVFIPTETPAIKLYVRP